MSDRENEGDNWDIDGFTEDDEDWSIESEEDESSSDATNTEVNELIGGSEVCLSESGRDFKKSGSDIDEESCNSSASSHALANLFKWDSNECSDEEVDPEYQPSGPALSPRVGEQFQAVIDQWEGAAPAEETKLKPIVQFDFVDKDPSMLLDYLASYDKMLQERKHPIPYRNVHRALAVLWEHDCKPGLALASLKKEIDEFYPDDIEYMDLELRMYAHSPQHPWKPYEIAAFEHGIKTYGKDFKRINDELLPNRSLADMTNFYYQFKVTDRYRMFPKTIAMVCNKSSGYMTRSETAKNEEPVAGPSHSFREDNPEHCDEDAKSDDGVKVEAITTFKSFVLPVNGESKVELSDDQEVSKAGRVDEATSGGNGDVNSVYCTGSYEM
uniref:SANT domain-containing protein n=1 Tax=Trichuris muris TaxID=70415 RepID=A0A5S6QDD2_TRIMR